MLGMVCLSIVRIVGKCYQLYCSKDVIETLFSCGELTPYTECPIPLDKWRQAPTLALKSSNCFEPCSCPLSETSKSVTILSSSEDENVGSDMCQDTRACGVLTKALSLLECIFYALRGT